MHSGLRELNQMRNELLAEVYINVRNKGQNLDFLKWQFQIRRNYMSFSYLNIHMSQFNLIKMISYLVNLRQNHYHMH